MKYKTSGECDGFELSTIERERETGRNSHNIPPPTIARTGRRQDVQGEDPDGGALPVRQDDDRQLPGGRDRDCRGGVQAHRRGQDPRVRAWQRQRQQQEHQGSDSYLLRSHFLLYSWVTANTLLWSFGPALTDEGDQGPDISLEIVFSEKRFCFVWVLPLTANQDIIVTQPLN